MTCSTLHIIGGGVSGLLAARAAVLSPHAPKKIVVHELQSRLGGMLQSVETKYGLMERAANGLILNSELSLMLSDLNLTVLRSNPESKPRYIFRDGRPRRWPLDLYECLALFRAVVFRRNRWKPQPGETVFSWGERVLGASLTESVLEPALQGIYAAPARELSASLVIGPILQRLRQKRSSADTSNEPVGTVSFSGGMQSLVDALVQWLRNKDVVFLLQDQVDSTALNLWLEDSNAAVVCTLPSHVAAPLLAQRFPQVSAQLQQLPRVSLTSATRWDTAHRDDWKGFGCLFPRSEQFNSMGVVFNSSLFSGRASEGIRSETYILPGEIQSESNLESMLQKDRTRLCRRKVSRPLGLEWTTWKNGLPLYGLELEQFLSSGVANKMILERVLPLGNGWGNLGLSQMIASVPVQVNDALQSWAERGKQSMSQNSAKELLL